MKKKLAIFLAAALTALLIMAVGCGPEGSTFALDDCQSPESPCAQAEHDGADFLATGDPDVLLVTGNEPNEGINKPAEPKQLYCYCRGFTGGENVQQSGE